MSNLSRNAPMSPLSRFFSFSALRVLDATSGEKSMRALGCRGFLPCCSLVRHISATTGRWSECSGPRTHHESTRQTLCLHRHRMWSSVTRREKEESPCGKKVAVECSLQECKKNKNCMRAVARSTERMHLGGVPKGPSSYGERAALKSPATIGWGSAPTRVSSWVKKCRCSVGWRAVGQ